MIKVCNRIVEYSFYALFLLVPLAFTSKTSELFELNKMWLVWGLTIIITASWLIKMILQKRILLCRTPLDIPIGLFLFSQVISTIFSLDFHVSLWGYYSRFNGGLLSIVSYIFLYYAFLSNLGNLRYLRRLIFLSLISGLIVALWGLPSHFGYDPTCLLFRGTFDVSCWTADFMPKIRIFSTLGQPDWLAAYLAILIPISIVFFVNSLKSNSSDPQVKNHESGIMNYVLSKKFIHNSLFAILASLFYVDLLFTRARSGFLGVWMPLFFFVAAYILMGIKNKRRGISNEEKNVRKSFMLATCCLLLVTFFIGTPINQLNKFTLAGIGSYLKKPAITALNKTAEKKETPMQPLESGGTESANIRLNVWSGAINAWKANPIFGTGVETFAFAYYKYKPVAQNLTSEWNFLYNKAHNEYLNYLATTGIVGLGSYLLMIGSFIFLTIKYLKNQKSKIKNIVQNANFDLCTLIFALLTSYISILITNFFGFSVVITNVYLFMIPAFVFVLTGTLPKNESGIKNYESSNLYQWSAIFFIILASLFMILNLFRFWRADIAFALGYNLDRAGEYQQAYPNLHKAVELRGDEPVFKDELSLNDAFIAAGLTSQKISAASSLAQEAINTSNEVISQHPNNAVFWKTRIRLFYTLSQVDPRYLTRTLDAIEKASLLAPNDANIWYNLGVLYGQNNNLEKGISALEKTIMLKPDYRDAHYALGLFYHTASLDTVSKVVIDSALQKKAQAQMQYILDNLNPQDKGALESIEAWK